jgi:ABC-2 type transport system ATP-binding protein
MGSCIVVKGLERRYGAVYAVRGISFTVEAGEVFALLGPNGAGKTTTVEILEGHRSRTAGSVSVLGFDPATGGRRFRSRIDIVLQEAGIDGELMVGEALELFAGLYPAPRPTTELISLVGLGDKTNARVRTLSRGQRRRLDLALGLVGDPDLLFLDEPTTGFDPEARRQAWELLDALRSLGKTILLTTHYMDEVQRLADRVAVLVAGRIVAEGTPTSMAGRDVGTAEIRFRLPVGASLADLPDVAGEVTGAAEREVVMRTEEPTAALLALTGWAVAWGGELAALTVSRPTLEDVYLRLVGARDGGEPARKGAA